MKKQIVIQNNAIKYKKTKHCGITGMQRISCQTNIT